MFGSVMCVVLLSVLIVFVCYMCSFGNLGNDVVFVLLVSMCVMFVLLMICVSCLCGCVGLSGMNVVFDFSIVISVMSRLIECCSVMLMCILGCMLVVIRWCVRCVVWVLILLCVNV